MLQFNLTLAHDGSGKGAALVAAVSQRMLQEKNSNEENNNMVVETTPSKTKQLQTDHSPNQLIEAMAQWWSPKAIVNKL